MTRTAQFLPADVTDVTDVEFEVPDREELTEAQKRAEALKEALSEDSEAFVTVHKHENGSGTSGGAFVDKMPADKYDHGELLIFLKREHGPGDYRIRLYANGRLKANKLVTIARPLNHSGEKSLQISPGSDAAQLLQQVLQPIREQQNQMLEFMRQTQERPNQMESMMQTMQMLAMFKDVLGGGNSAPANSLQQMRDMMALIKELKGDVIEGEKEEEGGFTKMIEALAPAFVAGMNAPAKQQNYRPNPAPQNQPQRNPQEMMLLNGFKMLINAASKKADPGHYAPLVIDTVGAEKVAHYCQSAESFASLVKMAGPAALTYAAWFEDLRQHLLALLGMPSKFGDLYDDADDAITGEIDDDSGTNDPDVPVTGNQQRPGGDSPDAQADGETR